jgi:hypothetical protein
MSRSSKKNSKDNPLGSHPLENSKEHRAFLIRSLERNDVDISALTDLNRSLHTAKESILQSCGELVLLDLGAGRLTLVNDELHEETFHTKVKSAAEVKAEAAEAQEAPAVHRLTPTQKQVCVDFLLRMKLRRKLSNRLARRLNRVAHAMDGEDVAPPPPPRYGDLRLNIDSAAVQARAEHWKRQAEAKQKILQQKWQEAQQAQGENQQRKEVPNEENEELKEETEESSPATTETTSPNEEEEHQTATAKNKDQDQPEGTTEDSPDKDKQESSTDQTAPMDLDSPGQSEKPAEPEKAPEPPAEPEEAPKPSAVEPEKAPEPPAVEPEKPVESEPPIEPEKPAEAQKAPDAIESSIPAGDKPVAAMINPDSSPPSLEEEYDLLKEYESAYEKVWDPVEKRFQYSMLLDEQQAENSKIPPDYTAIKHGMGIGATARIMSEQEREAEHKRWQTALMGRMPQQPTFEELGLKNRVFCLEERRKRYLEGDDEKEDDEEPAKKKLKSNDDDEGEEIDEGEESDEMEVDEDKEDDEKPSPIVPVKKIAGKELRKKSDASDDDEEKDSADKEGSKADDERAESAADDDKKAKKRKDGDDSSDMFDDDDDGSSKDEKNKGAEKKEKTDGDDDSSDMFGDDNEDRKETEDAKEADSESQSEDAKDEKAKDEDKEAESKPEDSAEGKEKDEEGEKKEAEVIEEPIKRIRPMLLGAVPSFHEQDMTRIKMIHGDLLSASILEHARRRLSVVTTEYNNGK